MKFAAALAAVGLFAASAASAVTTIPFTITLESEAPGIQSSRAGFDAVGIETFEDRARGTNQSFVSDFGGSEFTGRYSGVNISTANQFGGAGGRGLFATTGSTAGYSIDLSTNRPGGVTYFGFWLSALDRRNTVSFFSGGNLLFNFKAADASAFIGGLPDSRSYFCNPNAAFAGRNCGEPYAFLNFYARGGTSFDRIVFAQATQGAGYESDNHTVGQWNRISGTIIPIDNAMNAVPEPASWALLVTGFGLVGSAMRRGRVVTAR